MILTIRTDNPQSEIGLYSADGAQLAYKSWQAHRELSNTIHKVVKELLDSLNKDYVDITGIVFFAGPGSFTGLRIGASVANAVAQTLAVSVSNQSDHDTWVVDACKSLMLNAGTIAIPNYGAEALVSKPKK